VADLPALAVSWEADRGSPDRTVKEQKTGGVIAVQRSSTGKETALSRKPSPGAATAGE
jgi:hypothetical protein